MSNNADIGLTAGSLEGLNGRANLRARRSIQQRSVAGEQDDGRRLHPLHRRIGAGRLRGRLQCIEIGDDGAAHLLRTTHGLAGLGRRGVGHARSRRT
jgi:hypothetical protein